jgi:RNAse (barnase) inhibitor barstar
MPFVFETCESRVPRTGARTIPSGIESAAALLEALDTALDLPDYFGQNWDALDECIQDLSWIPPGPVVLVHEDLPLRNDREALVVYLSILRDAIDKWAVDGSRSLVVVFPGAVESEVQMILEKGGAEPGC